MQKTMPHLEADFFRANRRKLRDRFPELDLIVIAANSLTQKTTTESYPFQQDNYFYYLTGVDEPNIVLVLEGDHEYLIVPELSHARIMFDGDVDRELIRTVSGLDNLVPAAKGWRDLSKKLKQATRVGVLKPASDFIDSYGMFTMPTRKHLLRKLKNRNSRLEFVDVLPFLASQRRVKQPSELKVLQKSIDITCDALQMVHAKFLDGRYDNEFAVELELTRFYRQQGARGHGFDPIVASGTKGTQLHAMSNDAVIQASTPLLVDTGADFQYYCADITRSWHPRPTKRYREVHEAVSEVHEYALSLLKPDVVPMQYEKQVETFMGQKLLQLGVISESTRQQVRHYFPSLTSHFLGLDVHDVGSFEEPLQAGVVLTVEPGIYIPEEGIGIRIEDDVLITKTGNKVLSDRLPTVLV